MSAVRCPGLGPAPRRVTAHDLDAACGHLVEIARELLGGPTPGVTDAVERRRLREGCEREHSKCARYECVRQPPPRAQACGGQPAVRGHLGVSFGSRANLAPGRARG